MKPLGSEFIESFRRCKGVLWGMGGLAISIITFYVTPETSLSIKWLIPLGLAIALLIHCLWDLAFRCHEKAKPLAPRVIQGRSVKGGKSSLVLVEPNCDFYFEQFVSFYVLDGSFEVLAGVGYVANIQANGLILVQVVNESEGQKKLWENVRENNGTIISSIIIKPGAPKVFYDQIKYQL